MDARMDLGYGRTSMDAPAMTSILVTTLTGDWQPGYLPAAWAYGYGIYQETIACVGAGALEVVIEAVAREIQTVV